MKQPQLRVVDEHGQVHDGCPRCTELEAQLAGAERDVRAWRTRYAALSRDTEREAREHALWDEASELFAYWRKACRHPKAKFSADRFWLCLPFLERDGSKMCRRAIDGAAYDPFTVLRKNGSRRRFDSWELIHRDRGKWEEFVNKAPRNESTS